MKFYVIASAYSVMGQVTASVSVRELQPEGPSTELYTSSTVFPDQGHDNPAKYAIEALHYLAESL